MYCVSATRPSGVPTLRSDQLDNGSVGVPCRHATRRTTPPCFVNHPALIRSSLPSPSIADEQCTNSTVFEKLIFKKLTFWQYGCTSLKKFRTKRCCMGRAPRETGVANAVADWRVDPVVLELPAAGLAVAGGRWHAALCKLCDMLKAKGESVLVACVCLSCLPWVCVCVP